ncbi:MAG: L,D-transpeptidase [Candidatus Levybacteria bacterium]|nr:L,D-transpeptidase [Candidatus Levybacteria bacterium]
METTRRQFLKMGVLSGAGLFVLPKFGRGEARVLAKEYKGEESPTFYFSETGHHLGGSIAEFWRTRGGEDTFGMPITDVILESGMPVQYFKNARIELHPDNRIMLGLLGSELFEENGFVPVMERPKTPKFGRFYETNGAEEIFGYPISPVLEEEDQPVQYFQRAKFIHDPSKIHPEIQKRAGFYKSMEVKYGQNLLFLNEVQLANLGEQVAKKKGISTAGVIPKNGAIEYSTFKPSIRIMVDLTKQRLTLYEDETPVISTVISSGQNRSRTPVGKFFVRNRVLLQPYRGYNHITGRNYHYDNVPFNLDFDGERLIHAVYWHDEFKEVVEEIEEYGVSLGCVNLRVAEAEDVFNKAPVGTPIEISY